jgi:hypothetical protein
MPPPGPSAPSKHSASSGKAVFNQRIAEAIHQPRKHVAVEPGPRPPRGTWLALVYGGNGQGEIEPCG